MGEKNLVLCVGGVNDLIFVRDMKIPYYKSDDKRVCIGVPGDQKMTNERLCTGVSVAKYTAGLINLIWCQGTEIKNYKNLVLSILQIRDTEILVSKVCNQSKGKQMRQNPIGV